MDMQENKSHTYTNNAVIVIRLIIGVVFLIASMNKILFPYLFLSDVYSYRLLGPTLGLLVSVLLPWLELVIGICLLTGMFLAGTFLVSAILGAIFSGVIFYALANKLNISCGCLGIASAEPMSEITFVRAVLIMCASIGAYIVLIRRCPCYTT